MILFFKDWILNLPFHEVIEEFDRQMIFYYPLMPLLLEMSKLNSEKKMIFNQMTLHELIVFLENRNSMVHHVIHLIHNHYLYPLMNHQ